MNPDSQLIKDFKEQRDKPKLNRRQRRELMRLLKKGKGLKKTITKKIQENAE